jgi:hypothetical protein
MCPDHHPRAILALDLRLARRGLEMAHVEVDGDRRSTIAMRV